MSVKAYYTDVSVVDAYQNEHNTGDNAVEKVGVK